MANGDTDSYRSLGQNVSDSQRQIQQGKDSRGSGGLRAGLKAAGSSLSSSGSQMTDDARYEEASRIGPVAYKRGGKVRKTGGAIVHKGERVIPKKKVKRVEKMMRKAKMRMKARS
jgi:hypothetical protein